MDENVRPDDMERITTPELAQAVRRRGFLGGGGAAH